MAMSLGWDEVQRDMEQRLKEKPADDVKKKITIPNPVPCGNHLAHFIRSIHWNSKGMLPSTAGSKRSYDKYRTVTSLSFQGPGGFEIEPGEASGGFPRKKDTIEDIMLTPRNQMFNRWKVPDRMVDSAPPPRTGLNTPAESEACAPLAPQPLTSKAPILAPTPAPVLAASRMSREMSLPNIALKGATPRLESRNGLQQTSVKSARLLKETAPKAPALQQRSKTMFVDSRKPAFADKDKNGLPMDALMPEAVPSAQAWMQKAGSADKRVIERVLKMASKKNQLETSLRRTLLPDAKESVEKWMGSANEDERQVALNFFNSLAGGQLMGMTVESQRKRLKDVISTLEDAKPASKFYGQQARRKGGRNRKETVSDGNLKYIRLLTPNTRENRWMHSTWHHLPEYRDTNIVDNSSSHYIRPHQPVSRHFVIHPDWG